VAAVGTAVGAVVAGAEVAGACVAGGGWVAGGAAVVAAGPQEDSSSEVRMNRLAIEENTIFLFISHSPFGSERSIGYWGEDLAIFAIKSTSFVKVRKTTLYGRSNMKALSFTVYNESARKSISLISCCFAFDDGEWDFYMPG
jgi:hypothetical protein